MSRNSKSRPGKPTDNAYAEAFNSRVRAACMNAHWFLTLADAHEEMKAWRNYYNEDRPHGAIGHKPPISLHRPGDATSPSPWQKAGNSTLRCSNVRVRSTSTGNVSATGLRLDAPPSTTVRSAIR
jgi:hypothetical protein